MQWSRAFLTKEMAESTVMEFTPQKIELGTPQKALDYIAKKAGSDFRMNESIQVHTGVDVIEEADTAEKVEQRALEMLQEIQQSAYDQAYQLGLDEGRDQAFKEASEKIAADLLSFEETLKSIENMKVELLSQNEAHFLKLLYHMASRLAVQEVEQHDEAILEVLRRAISLAQDLEDIHVEMNPTQVAFVETLKNHQGREFEFLKRLRIDGNEKIRVGGCVIQTNSGEIDAQIETRLEQLWKSLSEVIPKVNDRITE